LPLNVAGFISDQAGEVISLRDPAGQTHTLSKDRIAAPCASNT
jgi:hypothetical protein